MIENLLLQSSVLSAITYFQSMYYIKKNNNGITGKV